MTGVRAEKPSRQAIAVNFGMLRPTSWIWLNDPSIDGTNPTFGYWKAWSMHPVNESLALSLYRARRLGSDEVLPALAHCGPKNSARHYPLRFHSGAVDAATSDGDGAEDCRKSAHPHWAGSRR